MATNRDPSAHNVGVKVFLAGIILQLISFAFFTFLCLHFLWKIHRHEPQLWSGGSKADRRWKHLYFAMLWTCIGFLIR
jgi:ABC-type Fe3+-siderophore transport system permease subunit